MVFTFIYGIGLGWSWPNLPKLVSAWGPREKAGVVTGIYSAGIYTGAALALAITMSLVFPITNTFQGTFFIWGIPPIVAAVLWWILVREPPSNRSNSEPVTGGNTLLRQVIRNRNLLLLSFFFLMNSFFLYTWTGWAPALLMLKGATPELAGVIASITIWAGIPAVFIIPRLSYKLGLRKPFLWVSTTTLAITAWATIRISLPLSWLPMALVGFADCTLLITTLVIPIDMVSEKEMGTATGLLLAIGHAGGLIGPWIAGHILDVTGSLNQSLLVLMGIAIAAVAIAFRLPETGPKAKK